MRATVGAYCEFTSLTVFNPMSSHLADLNCRVPMHWKGGHTLMNRITYVDNSHGEELSFYDGGGITGGLRQMISSEPKVRPTFVVIHDKMDSIWR